MSQYRPIMAGHPATQRFKAEEEDGVATTILHIASLEGEIRTLENLLRQGMHVDTPDQSMKTPLHLAAQCALILSPMSGHSSSAISISRRYSGLKAIICGVA